MNNDIKTVNSVIKEQKRIANKIIRKLSQLDCRFILAGGAPRDWFFKRSANDLDFWIKESSFDTSKLEGIIENLSDEKKLNKTYGNFENPIMYRTGRYTCIDGICKTYECVIDGLPVQFIIMNCDTEDVINTFGSSICMFWYDQKKIYSDRRAKFSILTKTIYYRDDFDPDKKYVHIEKMKKYFPAFKSKKMSNFNQDFRKWEDKSLSDAIVSNGI